MGSTSTCAYERAFSNLPLRPPLLLTPRCLAGLLLCAVQVLPIKPRLPFLLPSPQSHASFNIMKDIVEARLGAPMGTATSLLVAYVAGALNATATCPLWTIATRLKVEVSRLPRWVC